MFFTQVCQKYSVLRSFFNPDFAVGSEAQNTVAKRAVGEILRRRHIHRYVEE